MKDPAVVTTSNTIIIEKVSNGWIARPYPDFQRCGGVPDVSEWSCFTYMEELQRALPRLLGATEAKRSCLNEADSLNRNIDELCQDLKK